MIETAPRHWSTEERTKEVSEGRNTYRCPTCAASMLETQVLSAMCTHCGSLISDDQVVDILREKLHI